MKKVAVSLNPETGEFDVEHIDAPEVPLSPESFSFGLWADLYYRPVFGKPVLVGVVYSPNEESESPRSYALGAGDFEFVYGRHPGAGYSRCLSKLDEFTAGLRSRSFIGRVRSLLGGLLTPTLLVSDPRHGVLDYSRLPHFFDHAMARRFPSMEAIFLYQTPSAMIKAAEDDLNGFWER